MTVPAVAAGPAGDGVSAGRPPHRAADFLTLTKPRITTLIVLTTLAGYWEGRTGPVDLLHLAQTLAGTALVAAAAGTLNQVAEHRADAAMRRTAARPVASGRMRPGIAAAFGVLLLVVGSVWLWLAAGALASLLAVLTAASYLLAYTPLKKITPLATIIGAVPGAIPPMIGWAAVRGSLGPGAWALFLIVFLWQMPHFHALAAIYRRDYEAAGFRMLTVIDPSGARAGRQAMLYALLLVPVSLLPAWIGIAGQVYGAGALAMSLWFLWASIRFMAQPDDLKRAHRLFRVSLLYLPLVMVLMVAD
jgi:protoheme IX farnesyltransferase